MARMCENCGKRLHLFKQRSMRHLNPQDCKVCGVDLCIRCQKLGLCPDHYEMLGALQKSLLMYYYGFMYFLGISGILLSFLYRRTPNSQYSNILVFFTIILLVLLSVRSWITRKIWYTSPAAYYDGINEFSREYRLNYKRFILAFYIAGFICITGVWIYVLSGSQAILLVETGLWLFIPILAFGVLVWFIDFLFKRYRTDSAILNSDEM